MNVSLKIKIFESKGTRVLQVAKSTLTIGSASHCDIVLDHPSVAPEHTRAWLEGGRIWVQDLGSPSGCFLNEIRLPALKPMLVRDLDVLRLGECPSTLGLEAVLVRAPVVKPKAAEVQPKDVSVSDTKGQTAIELEKRREEAEQLGRELAALRLELQMSKLDKDSAAEMNQQLENLKSETKHVQEQKSRWEETLKKAEADKVVWRKQSEQELADFKVKAHAELKKLSESAARAEFQAQIESLRQEIDRHVAQKQQLNELARTVENDFAAFKAKAMADKDQAQATLSETKKIAVQKKGVEKELSDLQAKLNRDLQNQIAKDAADFENWKRDSLNDLSKRFRGVAQARLKAKALDKESADALESQLVALLRVVFLNEPEPAEKTIVASKPAVPEEEVERRSRRRPDKQAAARWRSVTVTSLIILLAFAAFWFGSNYYKQHGNRSFSSVAPASVEKETRVEAPHRFIPKTGKRFRGSYTENVLYLENYSAAEENEDFHKKWATELMRVAKNDWKMDTWSLAPLLVEEQTLIRDLEQMKDTLMSDSEKEGIEKMKAREGKFLAELESQFKTHSSIDRFLKFKRSFYQRNQAYLSTH